MCLYDVVPEDGSMCALFMTSFISRRGEGSKGCGKRRDIPVESARGPTRHLLDREGRVASRSYSWLIDCMTELVVSFAYVI